MAASLRACIKNGAAVLNSTKLCCNTIQFNQIKNSLGQQIRQMSGKNMVILPGRYEWTLFKDHCFFYFALHIIPMGALITYVNVTKGRCELKEIPEDYEPKYWEYYKHPISQFLARNCFKSPEGEYERQMHLVHQENEKRKLRNLEYKVHTLQSERGDYKGWYFVPVNPDPAYKGHENMKVRNGGIPVSPK